MVEPAERDRCLAVLTRRLPVALIAVLVACTYGATETLVTIDTDAPIDRALTITVQASGATMASGDAGIQVIRGGANPTATLPGSFGVVPNGASSGSVTLTITAQLDGNSSQPPIAFRRIARFSFVAHSTTAIPVFLAIGCGNLTTGCTQATGSQCTVSEYCEEQGQTCGDDGHCVSQQVVPTPSDGGLLVVSRESGVGDAVGPPPDATVESGVNDVVAPRPDATVPPSDASDAASGPRFDSAVPCDAANAIQCGPICIDPTIDANNCGGCGVVCPVACSNRACVTAAAVNGSRYATCAVLSDGTVRCWGIQNGNELGLQRYSYPRPRVVPGLANITQVVTGQDHGCALVADHSVLCWGDNTAGQLGDGTVAQRTTPLVGPVPGLTDAVQLSAGRSHTCARRMNGAVVCWGMSEGGETGPPTSTMCVVRQADADAGQVANMVPCATAPTAVPGIATASEISSGVSHTCALVSGTVLCWGSNSQDQLGYTSSGTCYQVSAQPDAGMGPSLSCSPTPTAVSGITTAVHIAAGGLQTCAALADGTISCWGHDDEGQLGDGMLNDRTTPALVTTSSHTPFNASVTSLAGGFDHMAVLAADGTIYTWGNGSSGQIGNGMTQNAAYPFHVPGVTSIIAGGLGWYHTCAILQGGSLECWGNNADSELGNLGMGGPNGLTPTVPFW